MRNPSTTTGTNVDSFRRLEVITGVGRRRRWSLEDKARIVAESLDPATTSPAGARRYGRAAAALRGGGAALGAARRPALGLAAAAATECIIGRDGPRARVCAGAAGGGQ